MTPRERPEEARAYYHEALEVATDMRFRPEVALTRLQLSELLLEHYPDERAEALVSDKDDMVVKGMSWALRDLLKRDRQAVERFLEEHEGELHARVKREVRNKLTTGRKNPPRKRD